MEETTRRTLPTVVGAIAMMLALPEAHPALSGDAADDADVTPLTSPRPNPATPIPMPSVVIMRAIMLLAAAASLGRGGIDGCRIPPLSAGSEETADETVSMTKWFSMNLTSH